MSDLSNLLSKPLFNICPECGNGSLCEMPKLTVGETGRVQVAGWTLRCFHCHPWKPNPGAS